MGVKERREREKQELRDRIMDAARTIFATEGYDAVSMRRIAEAIEYSPAAIYAYFPDKETLFREICRSDFAQLAGPMAELSRIDDPVRRLQEIGLAYVEFGVSHPNHYKMMFMTHHAVQPTPEDMAHKGDPDEDSYAFLLNTVCSAMETGRFRPEITDPELVAQVLWAAVHGVTSLQITHHDDPWLDWRPLAARVMLTLDAILRGMLRDPSDLDSAGEGGGR